MVYLKPFEHDVFISYTRDNNQPRDWGGSRLQWVTEFRNALEGELVNRLDDSIRIWWDQDIPRSSGFSKVVSDALSRSALFLAVVSRPYLNSAYCLDEARQFAQKLEDAAERAQFQAQANSKRSFLVLIDDLPHTEWPKLFDETNPFRFFSKAENVAFQMPPGSAAFQAELGKLAVQIKGLLEAARPGADEVARTTEGTIDSLPTLTVFLSTGPDDGTENLAPAVVRSLRKKGRTVIVPRWTAESKYMPLDAPEGVVAVDLGDEGVWAKIVERVSVSIHLLSKRSDALARKRVDDARAKAKASVVWFPWDSDMAGVTDAVVRNWLEQLRRQEPKENFRFLQHKRSEVQHVVAEQVEKLTPPSFDPEVLISYQMKDIGAATALWNHLLDHGCEAVLDRAGALESETGDVTRFTNELERRRGVVVLVGDAHDEWIIARATWAATKKFNPEKEVVFVCVASPPVDDEKAERLKARLRIKLPWIVLEGKQSAWNFDESAWDPVLRLVRQT